MGGVHKLNEIGSLTHLQIMSHKTVEKRCLRLSKMVPSRDSMVDTICAMSMHSQDRSLLTIIVN